MCVCIVVSNIHCVVFLLYFISYCVSFSRLSCLDCLWYSLTFSNRRLTFFPNCIWTPTSSAKHNNFTSVVGHTSQMLFHFNTVTTNFNGKGEIYPHRSLRIVICPFLPLLSFFGPVYYLSFFNLRIAITL